MRLQRQPRQTAPLSHRCTTASVPKNSELSGHRLPESLGIARPIGDPARPSVSQSIHRSVPLGDPDGQGILVCARSAVEAVLGGGDLPGLPNCLVGRQDLAARENRGDIVMITRATVATIWITAASAVHSSVESDAAMTATCAETLDLWGGGGGAPRSEGVPGFDGFDGWGPPGRGAGGVGRSDIRCGPFQVQRLLRKASVSGSPGRLERPSPNDRATQGTGRCSDTRRRDTRPGPAALSRWLWLRCPRSRRRVSQRRSRASPFAGTRRRWSALRRQRATRPLPRSRHRVRSAPSPRRNPATSTEVVAAKAARRRIESSVCSWYSIARTASANATAAGPLLTAAPSAAAGSVDHRGWGPPLDVCSEPEHALARGLLDCR